MFKYILLLFFITSFSQNNDKLYVQYRATLLDKAKKYDSITVTNPELMELILQLDNDFEDVVFSLKIDGKTSEFETIRKMTLWHERANPVQLTMEKTKFYVDSITFIEQRKAFEELYLMVERSNKIKWKLSNETKTILGHVCYKATTTKMVLSPIFIEAWYAPKLPYNFGPFGYHGLSGLILEIVQNEKIVYTADYIDWNEDVFVIKPTTGKLIPREKLNERFRSAISEKLSNPY